VYTECSRAVSHPSVFARAVSVVTFCPSNSGVRYLRTMHSATYC